MSLFLVAYMIRCCMFRLGESQAHTQPIIHIAGTKLQARTILMRKWELKARTSFFREEYYCVSLPRRADDFIFAFS
ncbi:hypothetical protein BX070DRAFT_63497 [Coemansia spiralis]|nr:hypothetical protein BX070DRAFT_63497 [Coemansia spiralis]